MKDLRRNTSKSAISIALILIFGMATAALAELPDPGMTVTHGNTALVITDPQNDFLSPKGVTWGVVGESVTENNTVANIESLFKAAKQNDIPVFISPHYYYPTDKGWQFEGALETLMHAIGMFDRTGHRMSRGLKVPAPIGWTATSRTLTMARPSSPARTKSTGRKTTTFCYNFASAASTRSSWQECRPTSAPKRTCANSWSAGLKSPS